MTWREAPRHSFVLPGVLALLSQAAPVRAEQWVVSSWGESRLEWRALEAVSGSDVRTTSLTAGVDVSRSNEADSTRMSADLSGNAATPQLPGDRGAFTVQLGQSLSDALNRWDLSGIHRRDSTYGRRESAGDVGLGFGARTSSTLTAAWNRQLSERLSTRVSATVLDTRYSAEVTGGVDYRNRTLSPSLAWRWTETDSLGLQLSATRYRNEPGTTASSTRNLSLSWDRSLGEDQSVALSAGSYLTQTDSQVPVLVCPLPLSFCQSGLVNYVVATTVGRSSSRGSQYSASLRRQLDERSNLSATAARQVSPTGTGSVSREERASVTFDRSLTSTTSMSAAASLSRSSFLSEASAAGRPRVLNLSVGWRRRLAEDLTLSIDAVRDRTDGAAGLSAVTHRVTIALRYQGPTLHY